MFDSRRLLESMGNIPPAEPRRTCTRLWKRIPRPHNKAKSASGKPGPVYLARELGADEEEASLDAYLRKMREQKLEGKNDGR